jgi:2-oxoglutarate ferredoxin oxidoreductase subunit beta
MAGLAEMIEEAIRFPGFAFVNVQSPCVTYGQEEQQLKAHKSGMQALASLGHDASDRLKAMALASEYGTKLYTGVLYRNPQPPPTYEAEARRRQAEASAQARPKERILEMFRPQR